jgi:hypothetical protein
MPPPSDDVVIEAWRRTGGRTPELIEPVGSRRSKKSVLFRLVGVGEGGGSGGAKLCRGQHAPTERQIYEEVLPALPISLPRYYGSSETEEGVWLFLSDGGAERCDPGIPLHRALAARWLARLHRAGFGRRLEGLPDRGPAHHLGLLRRSRQEILDNLGNPAFEDDHRAVLNAVLESCDELERSWDEIEAFASSLPRTLVHGDFCRKNLHVVSGPDGPEFFPMDWEMAGWGLPACDLLPSRKHPKVPIADVDVYRAAIRDVWPELDGELLRRVLGLGRVFRNLAGITWACADLGHRWPEKPVPRMQIYRDDLDDAVKELAWAA